LKQIYKKNALKQIFVEADSPARGSYIACLSRAGFAGLASNSHSWKIGIETIKVRHGALFHLRFALLFTSDVLLS